MRNHWIKVLFMLSVSLIVTGCWDAAEIDQLALVTASGLDLVQSNDEKPKVEGYLQIAIPTAMATSGSGTPSGESGSTKSFLLTDGSGQDIVQALQDAKSKISRKVILSHRRVMVVGEDFAKAGVRDLLDEIIRNPRSRMRTVFLVAYHGKALPILQSPYPLERMPQEAVMGFAKETSKLEFTVKDFVAESDYGDPYTFGIEPAQFPGGLTNTGFQLMHIALFRGNRLAGWLSKDEFDGFMWLRGLLKTKLLSTPVPGHDGNVDATVLRTKTTREVGWYRGNPIVSVSVDVAADVVENASNLNLRNDRNVQLVENVISEQIKQHMRSALDTVQKRYQVDPLGVAESVYRSNPRWWHAHEANWRQAYSKIPVSIQVKVVVRRTGVLTPNV